MKKDKFGNIQKRIDKLKNKKSTSDKADYHSSKAFNIAVEMVAGAIVGLIIGMFFDNLFDSKPIFLILCIILSVSAAFRLIWKNIN